MRFTIGRKLRLGFIAVLVLMGAIGWVSIMKMTSMGNKLESKINAAISELQNTQTAFESLIDSEEERSL